jgi:chromosome segregation ATPase
MDALDNKRDRVTVKEKLSDITTELLSIEENDKVMKGENSLLKRELSALKKAIISYENLMLQKIEILNETGISVLAEKMENEDIKFRQELRTLNEAYQRVDKDNSKLKQELKILNETSRRVDNENSKLKQELGSLNETSQRLNNENSKLKQEFENLNETSQRVDNENSKLKQELGRLGEANQRIDKENSKLQRELNNLKTMSLNNKQSIDNFTDTSETISKSYDDMKLQFHIINGSVQDHDSQLIDISSQLSSGK